jgi:hypothetical protein
MESPTIMILGLAPGDRCGTGVEARVGNRVGDAAAEDRAAAGLGRAAACEPATWHPPAATATIARTAVTTARLRALSG